MRNLRRLSREDCLVVMSPGKFVVARNPDKESKLPFLVMLPLEGGVVLKARDKWPVTGRIYCHDWEGPCPPDLDVLEEVPVTVCKRRGPAIDLVLDRPRLFRSQFVFTEVRGRPAIFWQTQKAARNANPGARVPRRRAAGLHALEVVVDTRERYAYRFAGRAVETQRLALPAGDYAVKAGEEILALVERKSLENFSSSLSDGTLAFQMQRLSEFPNPAIVVEGRYSTLFKLEHVAGTWLVDVLARLQVRYPEVPIVFADSRKFAEEWTYRFLGTVFSDQA
jgi:hypothetical protein